MYCILTSTSEIKKKALECVLNKYDQEVNEIICVDTSECGNPEQPVGLGGLICCKRRIEWVLQNKKDLIRQFLKKDITNWFSTNWCIVSIENAIETDENENCVDVVHCLIYTTTGGEHQIDYGNYDYIKGGDVKFPKWLWDRAQQESTTITFDGWSKTVGEIYATVGANPKNWMITHSEEKIDRKNQIVNVLSRLYNNILGVDRLFKTSGDQHRLFQIVANVSYINNYPKEGVLFKDLSKVLSDPTLLKMLLSLCKKYIKTKFNVKEPFDVYKKRIDYIIGLESRGFILGSYLAEQLDAGFVMVRKKGKLCPPTISVEYEKEYGNDCFEIQTNIMKPNSRVLIVDDLLATGGSIDSAVKLVEKLDQNIEIAGCFTVLKVDELFEQAKEKLKDIQIEVLV